MENIEIQFTLFSAFYAPLIAVMETGFLEEEGIAATRQLAKRQITWLRRWPDALKVVADTPDQTIQAILKR